MKTNTFPLIFSIKNFPFFLISHINHLKDELSQNKKKWTQDKIGANKIICIRKFYKIIYSSNIYICIINCCVVTAYKQIAKMCICNTYTIDE